LLAAAAIERSGQTAREFARQRLFEPLDIDAASWYWPIGPQEIIYGWGGLRLHPHGMAKIGQLFLDQGDWNGTPVVSSEWVEQATQPSELDPFIGYLWWPRAYHSVLEPSYRASGRGGQHIVVKPDLDLVVVSTGSALLFPSWTPGLMGALQPDAPLPLPPNLEAHQRLMTALIEATKPPVAVMPDELPPIATEVSGEIYLLDDNQFGVRCSSVHFDDADPLEASTDLTLIGQDGTLEEVTLPIGMDGVLRFSGQEVREFEVGMMGEWTSPTTFVLRYHPVAGVDHMDITFDFGTDTADVDIEFFDRTGYFDPQIVQGRRVDADTCPAE
jgi:hypothetical protein